MKKKRTKHYEPKLQINATLDEVLKISLQPDIKPTKKAKKK
jgi:hypothetical protein